jgi:hypothetical protein
MTKRNTKLANTLTHSTAWALGIGLGLAVASTSSWAQFVTTPAQKATAQRVAQAGVALSELNPNAPDSYTVKSGDTLWAISRVFLKSPWRWPELWGMNLQEIRNPHRIYPGQRLFLDKSSGRAVLRLGKGGSGAAGDLIRVSPRVRSSSLSDSAIPTIDPRIIEPFLAEPLVIDENTLNSAPRIVAVQDRVLLSRGDRAYVRAQNAADLSTAKDAPYQFRVFRNATPLKDPNNGNILGYEAEYLGDAELARGESVRNVTDKDGKPTQDIVPGTIDITFSKQEMRVGDRMLPVPPREFTSYTPRAPEQKIEGARIVSVYGSAVENAAQNQVITINRGKKDGLETGHVLAILNDGASVLDRTDAAKPTIKLPDERNGLALVFRTFDKVSYALILEITEPVRVGDHLINPR